MHNRFYFAVLASLALTFGGGCCLVLEPSLAVWLLISSFVAGAFALYYGYDRGRHLTGSVEQGLVAVAHQEDRAKRAEKDRDEARKAVRELQELNERNQAMSEELARKLGAAEEAINELKANLGGARARLNDQADAIGSINTLAADVVRHAARLVEAAMAADKAGQKAVRDEALMALVRYKSVFCEDKWLLEHWYARLPSMELFPTSVLQEFVGSELFTRRTGVINNTPFYDELDRALARKYV